MPSRILGLERHWVPCWTMRSYFRAASTILRPSKMLCEPGFSHVDVLARLAGPDRLQGVPVVRRGQAHGVDRLVVQELAVVGVARGLACRRPSRARPAAASMRFSSQSHIAAISTWSAAICRRAPQWDTRPRPPSPTTPTRKRSAAPAWPRAMAGTARVGGGDGRGFQKRAAVGQGHGGAPEKKGGRVHAPHCNPASSPSPAATARRAAARRGPRPWRPNGVPGAGRGRQCRGPRRETRRRKGIAWRCPLFLSTRP